MSEKIKEEVKNYYTDKIKTHGTSPQGVDWNSTESQELRFSQLARILPAPELGQISVLDFGCGYGAFYEYLKKQGYELNYCGFDLSVEMLAEGKKLFGEGEQMSWVSSESELQGQQFDFVIASGIFNVRMKNDNASWKKYILETLTKLNDLSRDGFSFNILTSYSDDEYMADYLYYAEPEDFFAHCKKNFSRNVALLHDYDLYEFTLLIRKL